MAETLQCENCGASMASEDVFCGECGAPRPALASVPPASRPAPPPSVSTAPPPPGPYPRPGGISPGGRTAARVIAILAATVAVGLCGLGLILVFFAPETQAAQGSATDMIVGASALCFCPALLSIALALGLWAFVIRRK